MACCVDEPRGHDAEQNQPVIGWSCEVPLTGGPWRHHTHGDRKQSGGSQGWGRGGECLMGTGFSLGEWERPEDGGNGGCDSVTVLSAAELGT